VRGESEYISKIAKTEQEICTLIEAGFEYVTDFQGSKIFKKEKVTETAKSLKVKTPSPFPP